MSELLEVVCSRYRPHPVVLEESANMRAVCMPALDDRHMLHNDVALAPLSQDQVRAVCYAVRALDDLDSKAFFLGDATGTGKTRTAVAVALDRMARFASTRILWISCRAGLEDDVQQTFALLSAACPVVSFEWHSKTPPDSSAAHQVLFSTYASLRSKSFETSSLVTWLQQSHGLVIFDEAHFARKPGSATQEAVLSLQRDTSAGVLYMTATAASDVDNLSYMERLGLFSGSAAPFANYRQCARTLRRQGIAMLELVSLFLKTRGVYIARSFRTQVVESPPVELSIEQSELEVYEECCTRWQAADRPPCTSAKQNFFLRLLTNWKAAKVLPFVLQQVAAGRAVIISLQSTGGCCRATDRGIGSLLRAMRGNGVDSTGLRLPVDALDTLYLGLSAHAPVAEITGRSGRFEYDQNGSRKWRTRTKSMIQEEINAFQTGRCNIALVSAAGGNGLSLHAAVTDARPRLHLLLELPWGSESLVQQMGRSHRTGEHAPPEYRVVTINVPIDQRVAQAVNKKIQSLSALTHGDRDARKTPNDLLRLEPKVVQNVALELLFREADHRFFDQDDTDDNAKPMPRSIARQVLCLGSVWNETTLRAHTARQLCKLLDEYESTDPTSFESQRLAKIGRQVVNATQVFFPGMVELFRCRVRWRKWGGLPEYVRTVAETVRELVTHRIGRWGELSSDLCEIILNKVFDIESPADTLSALSALYRQLPRTELLESETAFARLAGVPVATQRCYWSAVWRTNRQLARTAPSRGHGKAVDVLKYVYPRGVPGGYRCKCAHTVVGPGKHRLELQLVPTPVTQRRSRVLLENLLERHPQCLRVFRDQVPTRHCLFYSATNNLRLIYVRNQTDEIDQPGTWDMELWVPAGGQPLQHLRAEQWNDWAKANVFAVDAAVPAVALRQQWMVQERLLEAKRQTRTIQRIQTIHILDASRALHEWSNTTGTLVRALPPLTTTPLIGAVLIA
jgi:hypothetical protein